MEISPMRIVNGIYGFLLGFLCSLPLAFALSVAISCFWHPEGSLVGIERTATGLRFSGPLAIHGVAMLLPLMMGVLGFMRSAHEADGATGAELDLDSVGVSTCEADLDPATAIARRLDRRTWRVPPALLRRETRRVSTVRF
jgi:hypothetical protein